jgi:AraC family transcriptional regulator
LARARPKLGSDALLRVVARVQSDLAGDLRLAALAAEARQSCAHFQRAFTAAVGVSPSAYVARVRVERAAYLMRVQRASLLDIALSVGFSNPDTFTRAFRRRFGTAPSSYRRRDAIAAELVPMRRDHDFETTGYSLSPTRIVLTRAMSVAFVRHVGPYEEVDPAAWVRLVAWAKAKGLTHGWCIGIGHDAPGVTAPADLRFDAGVVVGDGVRPHGGVGVQTLPAARYAVTTHVGLYSTLTAAYREIFARSAGIRGHTLVGLPVVEIYHDATVDPARPLSSTDVMLPVTRGRR